MDKAYCQRGLDNSAEAEENLSPCEEKIELRTVKAERVKLSQLGQ
jgi:hypothetical protein